ncbi:hypothetical protein N0V93_007728 [Gnomoniopsis smithogilvyi]|uniref:Uncharacterized protein n=1 Tax=Gnomoniopsis smithogilvyi TaxID=1191159 RepID=A0A9W9CU73_9PEZI|nr:hypothetical protein N0V93_007728 [Gnomoniopsis smithogilvyi]
MSFRPVNHRPSQVEASDNKGSASVSVSTITQVSPRDTAVSYPLQKQTSRHSGSQATLHSSNSTESIRVFTPPIIERSGSNGAVSSGQGSSQESQLLQLSQLAAAQEKMPDYGARSSVKRAADGTVKDARSSPTASPPRPSSHSRNVSAVSAASTASSHFTDLSWDLKTRLTPHTPAVAPLLITPTNRNLSAAANPMVVSPTHNNREKDAMEALLFMSSPGNSANMKTYQPGPQPMSSLRNGATSAPSSQRKPLPKSAPKRKGLPNGRPVPSSQPLPASHSPQKRVGFGSSPVHPSEMDLDDPTSPRRHAAYVRPAVPSMHKVNGLSVNGRHPLPSSGGLRKPERPRQRLSLEHLDEVLDRVAAEDDSSDSEGEILLPSRREGLGTRY